jgi:hypothetical protein
VTSQFPILVSHRSSVFLRVILLMVFVTQLTADLQARSQVSCHNFFSLCLCLIHCLIRVDRCSNPKQ